MRKYLFISVILLCCSALCSCGQGHHDKMDGYCIKDRYYCSYSINASYDDVWTYVMGYLYKEDYTILVVNILNSGGRVKVGTHNSDDRLDGVCYIYIYPSEKGDGMTKISFFFPFNGYDNAFFADSVFKGITSLMNDCWVSGEKFDLSDYTGENH